MTIQPTRSSSRARETQEINNRILEIAQGRDVGYFEDKLNTILAEFQKTADLPGSIRKAFPVPSMLNSPSPSVEDIKSFSINKGFLIGSDVKVLNFLEDRVSFSGFSNHAVPNDFLSKITDQDDLLLRQFKMLLNRRPQRFAVSCKEDVAFCGVLGLIEKAFEDKKANLSSPYAGQSDWGFFKVEWEHLEQAEIADVIHNNLLFHPKVNILGIPKYTLDAIAELNTKNSPNFDVFLRINSSPGVLLLIKPNNIPMGRKIENLVSYGTSILSKVFPEMSIEDLDSMSLEDKVMLLRTKKAEALNEALKGLSTCFFVEKTAFDKTLVNRFRTLERLLKNKKSLEQSVYLIEEKLNGLKKQIEVFVTQSDYRNDLTVDEFINEYISSINKNLLPTKSLVAKSLLSALKGYESLLKVRRLKSESLAKVKSLTNVSSKDFFEDMAKLVDQVQTDSIASKYKKTEFLQFHFFTQFILENNSIFPTEHKIANSAIASSKKLLSEGFEKLKKFKSQRAPEDPFAKALDDRSAEIFYEYQPSQGTYVPRMDPSSVYSTTSFSEGDVQKLLEASQKIQKMLENGDHEAVKKQNALISIIQKNITATILSDSTSDLDKKGALLSATLEAAKILTDADKLKELRQSVGAFLEVLTGGSLKKSLEETVNILVETAVKSRILPEQKQQLEEALRQRIPEIVSQASAPVVFEVQRDPSFEKTLARVQAEMQKLRVFFRTQVFDVYNGYKNLIPAMEGKLPGDRPLALPEQDRAFNGTGYTYGDGYRALARLWESLYGFGEKKAKSYVDFAGDIQNNPLILGKALFFSELLDKEIQLQVPTIKLVESSYENSQASERFSNVFLQKTLSQWYELARSDAIKNQNAANQAYGEFLYPYILSFTNVGSNILGVDRLEEAKFNLLRDLPMAREVFDDIRKFQQDNESVLRNIENWLRQEIAAKRQELEDNPDGQASVGTRLATKATRMLINNGGRLARWTTNRILDLWMYQKFIAICNETGVTKVANAIGLQSLLEFGGKIGFYMHGETIRNVPFVAAKTVLTHARQFTQMGEYAGTASVESLGNMIKSSIELEILSINEHSEPGHRFNNCLYLAEMFSALEAMQSDVSEFTQRISSIINSTNGKSQISVMACNMASFLMSNVIRIMPPQLLAMASAHNASGYGFEYIVRDFLSSYKELLTAKRNEYKGQDKTFGPNTPFAIWLRTQNLRVACDGDEFEISVDQIIPWDNLNPIQEARNVTAFQENVKDIMKLKPLFLERQRQAVLNIQNNLQGQYSVGSGDKAQAEHILKAALWQVKYSFQLAYQAFLGINPYIIATGTTVESALSGHLFTDGLDTLQKVVDLASSLGVSSAHQLGEYLNLFKNIAREALANSSLVAPISDLEAAKELLDALINTINTGGFDLLALPVLAEYSNNKEKLFNHLILSTFEESSNGADFSDINPRNSGVFLAPAMENAFKFAITEGFYKPALNGFLGVNLENTNFMPRQPVLRLGRGRERNLVIPAAAMPTSQTAQQQLQYQQQQDIPVDPAYQQQLNAYQQNANMQALNYEPHLDEDYHPAQNTSNTPMIEWPYSSASPEAQSAHDYNYSPMGGLQQPPEQSGQQASPVGQTRPIQQQQQSQRQSPGQPPQNSAMPYAMMAATNAAYAYQQPQQQLLEQQAQQEQMAQQPQPPNQIQNLVGVRSGTGNSPGGSYNFTASDEQLQQLPQLPGQPYVRPPLPRLQPPQDRETMLPQSGYPYGAPNVAPMLPQPPGQPWSTGQKVAAGLAGAALVASAVAAIATSVHSNKKKKRDKQR